MPSKGVPETGSFSKQNGKRKWFIPTERPYCYQPFPRPLVCRDTYIFAASASPGTSTKKNWLCHPPPLFMTVTMIQNMWHSEYCKRHSWLTQFGASCLNHPVASQRLVYFAVASSTHLHHLLNFSAASAQHSAWVGDLNLSLIHI